MIRIRPYKAADELRLGFVIVNPSKRGAGYGKTMLQQGLKIPIIIYLAFDYIIGRMTGHFVYGIFDVNEMKLVLMIFVVCGVYTILIVLACITQFINKKCSLIRKKLNI